MILNWMIKGQRHIMNNDFVANETPVEVIIEGA